MNLTAIDLNLLVYLDVLLQEKSVSKAAEKLGLSQPAMSHSLKRLRDVFNDPLLQRTSVGMKPTPRALAVETQLRELLNACESLLAINSTFEPASSDRVFRIVMSDYAEAVLLPTIMRLFSAQAPDIALDVLNPSDVSFFDIEQGNVDCIINRFDHVPDSFHSALLWTDTFSCLLDERSLQGRELDLETYLDLHHIWVSKTGMGSGVGINPRAIDKLGWVDLALKGLGLQRSIGVFTRNYQTAVRLAAEPGLIATIPTHLAELAAKHLNLYLVETPIEIPQIELHMVWGHLMHHDPAHRWLRSQLKMIAAEL